MSIDFTMEVAHRAANVRYNDLPKDVVELFRQCLVDWLGVTIAGSSEPCATMLLAQFIDDGGDIGDRGVGVVGRTERLPLLEAAIVNGTASHALDYDDVNESMLGHPTVPIMAGLLALAEQRGASGREVICAFVAGYETECRVGRAIGASHYQRGFHATGTVGTFGAAAACGRLLRLNDKKMAIALGLAGAQAAGLKSMFGTMGKPFHAGKASANGLLAAQLAARGFTAAPDVIEGVQGFVETAGDGVDEERLERALQPPRHEWHLRDNLFKYHAACFQTHSSIEGLRRLREEHGFKAGDVAEAFIDADEMQLRMCAIPEPTTGLEVKFSLRHTGAMALSGVDTSAIASFTDKTARQRDLVDLRSRIAVRTGRRPGGPTPVEVRLRNGEVLTAAHDVSIPEADLALQRRRLVAKFHALAAATYASDQASRIADTALALPATNVEALTTALAR